MAAEFNIKVNQGEDYAQTFTWKQPNDSPYNITGWSAKMQVRYRDNYDAPELLTLTDGEGLTLGGTAGTVLVEISHTQASTLPSGDLVYDIKLTDTDGKVRRFLQGTLTVSAAVTL